MGARASVEVAVAVSVDGVVGGAKVVGVAGQLAGLPSQCQVLCGRRGPEEQRHGTFTIKDMDFILLKVKKLHCFHIEKLARRQTV